MKHEEVEKLLNDPIFLQKSMNRELHELNIEISFLRENLRYYFKYIIIILSLIAGIAFSTLIK